MDLGRLNIFKRINAWKANIAAAVEASQLENALLRSAVDEISSSLSKVRSETDPLAGKEGVVASIQAVLDKHSAAFATIKLDLTAVQDQAVAISDLLQGTAELTAAQADITAAFENLKADHDELASEAANLFKVVARSKGPAGEMIADAGELYLNERGDNAIIVACLSRSPDSPLRSGDVGAILKKIADGALKHVFVTVDPPPKGKPAILNADVIVDAIREMPKFAEAAFSKSLMPAVPETAPQFYRQALSRLRVNPQLVSAVAEGHARNFGGLPAPFDSTLLPPVTVAQPKRRSAIFLHNNYYHFNHLAEGLRRRGWDALTVSIESPDSPQRQFYHGEDINLFDTDHAVMREKVRTFFATVPERFGALHFYGDSSFFPDNFENVSTPTRVPWDFFELRRHRMVIGYMPSGCLDGARQSDIRRITDGLCGHCVWERQPSVCSDARSAAWAERLEAVCDWVGLEGDWVVGPRTGARFVRGPVVTALDPDKWSPQIQPPEDMRIPRAPDEVLVYHAVGNFEARKRSGRDIKGTGAVLDAVSALQAEGLPVRLIFFSNVPSTKIRYFQIQADIVIDQLRYGRYGANARECMMLGKPVIGALNPAQEDTDRPLRLIEECPIVNANTETITDVLRSLVVNPVARERAGRAAREFALRWHSADACAERYEKVIDRLQAGQAPDSPDLYSDVSLTDANVADLAMAKAASVGGRRGPAE